MSLSFPCTSCGRTYTVNDSLAGKKAKCKACGAEMRIPTPAAPTPAPPAADLYGLDEEPATAARRVEVDAEEPMPVAPRRVKASKSKQAKKSGHGWHSEENRNQFRGVGTWLIVGGAASFVLPFLGLQLRVLNNMPPEAQVGAGVLMIVVGGFCLLYGATGSFLKTIGVSAVGLFALVGLATVLLSIAGPRGGGAGAAPALPPGLAGMPPAGFPNAPPGGFPPGVPSDLALPPWEREPQSDVRVALSNGRYMRNTSMIGTEVPGVAMSVDYAIESGRVQGGERLILVISSGGTRGELDNLFELNHQRSGTISAESFQGSTGEGPFEAWMEVGSIGGPPGAGKRKKVSETIALNFTNVPVRDLAAEARQAAMEGAGGPPGMGGFPGPGGPPQFPGRQ